MQNSRAHHWPHFLAPKEEKILLPFLWIGALLLSATTLIIYAYAQAAGM